MKQQLLGLGMFLMMPVIPLQHYQTLAEQQACKQLENKGIVLTTQVPHGYCQRTQNALERVDRRALLNLKLEFVDKDSFECGKLQAIGCFYWDERKVAITPRLASYEVVLLHEIGHSTGLTGEAEAWDYANKTLPENLTFKFLTIEQMYSEAELKGLRN
jgi:hypothetical protein